MSLLSRPRRLGPAGGLLALVGASSLLPRAAAAQTEPGTPPAPAPAPLPPPVVVATPPDATAQPGAVAGASATATVGASVTVPRATVEQAATLIVRVPLRVGGSAGVGFTSQWEGAPLDGSMAEFAGSLGWVALPWLSIEARAAYLSLARRFVDANADGRADRDPGALTGFLGGLDVRFRLFHDTATREGWSFSLGGGYLHPLAGAGAHAGGAILEAAIGRHVGFLSDSRFALELGIELRGRTGVGAVSDAQSVQLAVTAAWEGDQARHRSGLPSARGRGGYAPGHTFGVEGSGAVFFGATSRPGTQIQWGVTGGGVAVAGGLVLARPFELVARAGYMGRAPARDTQDALHGVLLEGGARFRWAWLFAEADAGLLAPFGTFRDRVATTLVVGGAAGVRIPFGDPERDGVRLLLGLRTRVGVLGESAFDALLFSAGLEWEGGGMAPPPFPRVQARAAVPAATSGGAVAASGAAVGAAQPAGASGGSATGASSQASGGAVAGAVTGAAGSGGASAGGRAVASAPAPATPRGPSYTTVPLSITAGYNYGYIAPIDGVRLERTVGELSLGVSWVPAHWFALDLRGGYNYAAPRTEDTNRDGRIDWTGQGVTGVQLSLGPRFRLMYDADAREGWSVALAGGYFIPATGLVRAGTMMPREGGFTLEAAIARHVGVITDSHNAFGLAIEVRGRQGLANLGDWQSLTLGVNGSWEGNVRPNRSVMNPPRGWAPGHTFALDFGGLAFFDGGRRANRANRYFLDVGYTFGVTAGIVLTPAFELAARFGYADRVGVTGVADLAAVTLEGGPRIRYGWLALQGLFGYDAVFGTQRDEVASGVYAGAALQGRWEVVPRWRLLAGLTGRFGLGNERAFDQIGLSIGLEFEGGQNQASHFPSPPPPRPAASTSLPESAAPQTTDWRDGSNAGATSSTTAAAAAATTAPPPATVAGSATLAGAPPPPSAAGTVALNAAAPPPARPFEFARVPLRIAAGFGVGTNNRGLRALDLDGAHNSVWLTAAWVPRHFVDLELTGALINAGGHTRDENRDGRADVGAAGLTAFTLTLGPRFRLMLDAEQRHGWSFGLAGGLLATNAGTGIVGEAVLGRHLGTLGASGASFEIGVEARGRIGHVFDGAAPGVPDHGADYRAFTVGVTAAYEGGVARREFAARPGYQLGETLTLEGGYGVFLPYALRTGQPVAQDGLILAAGTGLVFAPAFELRARAGYVRRSGGEARDGVDILFAEGGPRFRWGWLYAELLGGYAGVFGTYRDSVAGAPIVGAGLGARFGLTGPGRYYGVTLGATARAGVSDERVYDQLMFSVGLEFEGGHQQAAPFPTGAMQALRGANELASGGATVRLGAAIGARAQVGGPGPGPLAPGYTFDADDIGRAGDPELTTDDVTRVLPPLTDAVASLTVTVSTPPGVDATRVEPVVTNAIRLNYADRVRVTTRVVAGAARQRFAISIAAE